MSNSKGGEPNAGFFSGRSNTIRAQRASNARLQQASFCDEAIVVRVTANPEPENAIWHVHREGAMVGTDAQNETA
ncbi:MAG: hypothetical protein IPP20_19580 [Gemmatimonadetes bacterium]|nr:hypothetical protein [Gemmatimonadota bacterium]